MEIGDFPSSLAKIRYIDYHSRTDTFCGLANSKLKRNIITPSSLYSYIYINIEMDKMRRVLEISIWNSIEIKN